MGRYLDLIDRRTSERDRSATKETKQTKEALIAQACRGTGLTLAKAMTIFSEEDLRQIEEGELSVKAAHHFLHWSVQLASRHPLENSGSGTNK
jgi:hypothetical protein